MEQEFLALIRVIHCLLATYNTLKLWVLPKSLDGFLIGPRISEIMFELMCSFFVLTLAQQEKIGKDKKKTKPLSHFS